MRMKVSRSPLAGRTIAARREIEGKEGTKVYRAADCTGPVKIIGRRAPR